MPAHAQSARRLVLVPAARSPEARSPAAVRRYRLGRLGFGPPPGSGGDRYAYLKRGHD
jgi:hypothetical protein